MKHLIEDEKCGIDPKLRDLNNQCRPKELTISAEIGEEPNILGKNIVNHYNHFVRLVFLLYDDILFKVQGG